MIIRAFGLLLLHYIFLLLIPPTKKKEIPLTASMPYHVILLLLLLCFACFFIRPFIHSILLLLCCTSSHLILHISFVSLTLIQNLNRLENGKLGVHFDSIPSSSCCLNQTHRELVRIRRQKAFLLSLS